MSCADLSIKAATSNSAVVDSQRHGIDRRSPTVPDMQVFDLLCEDQWLKVTLDSHAHSTVLGVAGMIVPPITTHVASSITDRKAVLDSVKSHPVSQPDVKLKLCLTEALPMTV